MIQKRQMTNNIWKTLLIAVVFSSIIFNPASTKAQFHYFEPTVIVGGIGKDPGDFNLIGQFSYFYHFSHHHAIGAQLAYHNLFLHANKKRVSYQNQYAATTSFKTYPFLSVGLSYRFYFNEQFYFESLFSLGKWHEEFTAQRTAYSSGTVSVGSINAEFDLSYRVLRIEPSFGAQFRLSEHLNLHYKNGLSIYRFNPPIDQYARVSTSSLTYTQFSPTQGTYFFLNFVLGLALKL